MSQTSSKVNSMILKKYKYFLVIMSVIFSLFLYCCLNAKYSNAPKFIEEIINSQVEMGPTSGTDITGSYVETFKGLAFNTGIENILTQYGFEKQDNATGNLTFRYECKALVPLFCRCLIFVEFQIENDRVIKVYKSTYAACA